MDFLTRLILWQAMTAPHGFMKLLGKNGCYMKRHDQSLLYLKIDRQRSQYKTTNSNKEPGK
jgi:hypothetical protein